MKFERGDITSTRVKSIEELKKRYKLDDMINVIYPVGIVITTTTPNIPRFEGTKWTLLSTDGTTYLWERTA